MVRSIWITINHSILIVTSDAELYQNYEGKTQIQRLIISQKILNQYEGTLINLKKGKIDNPGKISVFDKECKQDQFVCMGCLCECEFTDPPETLILFYRFKIIIFKEKI
ncbi:MAG: hypothetical protein ACFFG0_09905 [Candidatus Thorarchaeota archaeon]